MLRTKELDVEQVRLAILQYARANGLQTDVLIAACADIVAMTAASLDRNGAAGITLDERMAGFNERVRRLYDRIGLMQPALGYNFAPGALKPS